MAILESSMEKKKSSKPLSEKKKSLLLAQDENYARNLSANNEKIRNKSLKYLKKYLKHRSLTSTLTEENLKILWKGLFYSMWMSDKPLIQEECAENISNLIHCMEFSEAMLFLKIGLETLQNEWFGIDQHRLDKFLMLVRRFLRQGLFVLKSTNFKKKFNDVFTKVLEDTLLRVTKDPPSGLFMHFTEIYLEELAKVADGNLQSSRTIDFLKPFIRKMAFANDNRVTQWINKFVFSHLMRQHKLGLEYEEKYKVWKAQKFAGSINQIQKVILSDDEDEIGEEHFLQNKPLDPRAGKVNVELPQILFNAKEIAEALLELRSDAKTSKHTRILLNVLSEKFLKLHNGIYPLGLKKLESKKRKSLENYDTNVTKAAKRLIKFEQKLSDRERREQNNKRNADEMMEEEDHQEAPVQKKMKKNKTESVSLPTETTDKKTSKKKKLLEAKKLKMMEKLAKNVKKKNLKLKQFNPNNSSSSIAEVDNNYWFERNSGIWFVTEEAPLKSKVSSTQALDNLGLVSKKDSSLNVKNALKSTPNPDLENGEYEIFIPSKTFITKLQKSKEPKGKEVVLISKLRGKSRASLNNLANSQGYYTPTKQQQCSKTGSPKKVVINMNLNVSQDIDDHIMQVKSSPQIPWDSSKKPGKPLLKTPLKTSPINPFYKL